MAQYFSLQQPLTSRLWSQNQGKVFYGLLLTVIGSMVIAVGAKIAVPLQPVPVTLQTLAVLLIAMIYGWRLGVASVVAYLAAGFAGMPVFASTPALLFPMLGYLLGFLPAVFVAGFLVERGWGRHFIGVLVAGMLATIAIYACGLPVLAATVGWQQALAVGLMPFMLIDGLKIIIAALLIPRFWKK